MNHHKPIGKHVLMDFRQCNNKELLTKISDLENLIEKYIPSTGSRIINTMGTWFNHAYTHLSIISESHSAVHTYPEYNAAFVEIFTCGETNPEYLLEPMLKSFQPLSGTITLKWRYLDEKYHRNILSTFDIEYVKNTLSNLKYSVSMTKYDEESIVIHFKTNKGNSQ